MKDTPIPQAYKAAQEAIVERVTRERGTSFVDLEALLDSVGYDYRGECEYLRGDFVIWAGWSDEAFRMFRDLVDEGRVVLDPTSVLTYVIDGKVLDVPVAKGNYKYTTPRWVPCTIAAGAAPGRRLMTGEGFKCTVAELSHAMRDAHGPVAPGHLIGASARNIGHAIRKGRIAGAKRAGAWEIDLDASFTAFEPPERRRPYIERLKKSIMQARGAQADEVAD